ncbi:hypothetical protein AZE42_13727 [Rhizopogon vesiculosus]|uniref:Uncharacterized protein n=1 Tax=Rhizopogon vesiculosus TaxID=180088 RepID=A0A1J8Q404_9AGAM|nr:hypothetical protein AZE42_13727 [Rhizopogon vesiculosus]
MSSVLEIEGSFVSPLVQLHSVSTSFPSSRDSVRWHPHVSDSYRLPSRICAQTLATRLAKRHKL